MAKSSTTHLSKPTLWKSRQQIAERVEKLGRELTERLKNTPDDPIFLCVLENAFMFFSDLIRHIDRDLECDVLAMERFDGGSIREVKLDLDVSEPLENRTVVLVKDLVDTGETLSFLQDTLLARKPRELITIALLRKPTAANAHLDFVGFDAPDGIYLGYGIDLNHKHREWPDLYRIVGTSER